MKTTRNMLTVVMMMAAVGLAAGAANAALVGQLGVLDVANANGGINPVTSNPWAAGDQYRLAFLSSTQTQATSNDITTYNTFLQGVAAAAGLGDGTWNVLGSTGDVDARDNTSTNPGVDGTGEAIFLVDGVTKIADNYAKLWDGSLDNPLTLNEDGVTHGSGDVFTGTNGDGTKRDRHLGGSDPPDYKVTIGRSHVASQWMVIYNSPPTRELPIYALSDPLTVTEAAPEGEVPEPATMLAVFAGLAGLGGYIKKRRGTLVRRIAMNATKTIAMLLAVGIFMALGGAATAATFSSSGTAPAIDGSDIAWLGTPTSSDKWWPDSATSYGNPGKTVGQSFSTGSEDVVLNAFTLKVTSATQPTKTYTIRVGSVSGTTFNVLHTETATQGFATADNDYWTWTLDSPVSLSGNTAYGVDVGLTSSTSAWQTGIPYVWYNSDSATYPDGTRFRTGTAGYGVGDSSMSHMSGDRVFHLDMTPSGGPPPPPGPVNIPVDNHGFEDPVLADGDWSWSMDDQGWGYFGNDGYQGSWNVETGDFPGEAPEGQNVGWAEGEGLHGGFAQVLTDPDAVLKEGMTYELTVEVGNGLTSDPFGGYQVQLLAGGTPHTPGTGGDYTGAVTGGTLLAEDDNSLTIADGTFETSTVTYTYDPAHAALLGQPLQIRLLAYAASDEVEFDNVRLTATPVGAAGEIPEPATMAMLGLAVCGLGGYVRKRRRG